jgi:ABC-type glycerol-3-phosphate transport system permease component
MSVRRGVLYAGLTTVSAIWLLPLLIVVSGALSGNNSGAFSIFPHTLTLKNIVDVIHETNIGRLFLNSMVVSVGSTLAILLISSLAAYGFAQYPSRLATGLLLLLLSGIMLAPAVIIVPLYDEVSRFGLLNNYLGLIGPYTAFGICGGVLLFRNAFLSIPHELIEAARIDGASDLRIYSRVCLPLSKSVIATVGILSFLAAWNDYLLALLFMTKEEMLTIQLAFLSYSAQYLQQYGHQFAVMLLAMLPVLIVFLLFQRLFIRGLTSGAINR